MKEKNVSGVFSSYHLVQVINVEKLKGKEVEMFYETMLEANKMDLFTIADSPKKKKSHHVHEQKKRS